MYSSIIRTNEYICALSDFIKLEYGIYAHSIIPAKRGFYGETWRLNTKNHNYFVKLNYSNAHKQIYERSFPVMEHLRNNGIDFISQVIKTKSGKLSSAFDGAVLGVFNWINGDNIETDETKALEYQMLAKIYTVPFNGLSIRSEDFSGNSSNRFFNQWNSLDNNVVYKAPPATPNDDGNHRADLSYKWAAVHAGLDFIGKNDVFVHYKYSQKVRISCLLVDLEMPLFSGDVLSECGDCDLCVKACPYNFISGKLWHMDIHRDELIDYKKCATKTKHSGDGLKYACGYCVMACKYPSIQS